MTSPKPRVVLVAHRIGGIGGMERVIEETILHLHERVDFVVVAARLEPALRPLVQWRRVRVPFRPGPLLLVCFWVRAGFAVRRARQGAVLHVTGGLIPNRADLATVHFCHAAYRQGGRPETGTTLAARARAANTSLSRSLGWWMEAWAYRRGRVGMLAAVSDGVAEEVRAFYPETPVEITPNGVDGSRFRPDAAARTAVRADQGVDDSRPVALFVGSDWGRKNLIAAVDAMSDATVPSDAHLWVLGSGDEERARSRASALGVSVRFLGPRPDVERFYAAADALLFPSTYEAFPLVVLEAAASGLPIVGLRGTSGLVDIVGDDEAGFLVDDPASIGGALGRLLGDRSIRHAKGAAARSRSSRFTWSANADRLEEIYRRLSRRGGP